MACKRRRKDEHSANANPAKACHTRVAAIRHRASNSADIHKAVSNAPLLSARGNGGHAKHDQFSDSAVPGNHRCFGSQWKNGFVIDGAGFSVSAAGDTNGDSIADLVVGQPGLQKAFVVFGSRSAFEARLHVDSLDGSNGFVIEGDVTDNHRTGHSVGAAGDVNGDGIADILVSTMAFLQISPSKAYVVFGNEHPWPSNMNLSAIDGSNGFAFLAQGDYQISLGRAGDINDDGLSDIVIGEWEADAAERYRAGLGYVVFG